MSTDLKPVYQEIRVNSHTTSYYSPPPYPSTTLQGRTFSLNASQLLLLVVLIAGVVVGASLGTWFGIAFGADPLMMGFGVGIFGCFAVIGGIDLIASTILKRSSG